MEKFKNFLEVLGIGVVIGVILTVILVVFLKANPSSINLGPVEFEIPTVTTPSTSQSFFELSATPTSETALIESNNEPIAEPTYTPISLIQVPGYQQAGVRFDASSTGKYRFTILRGAYSSWPTERETDNQWRTIVYIYKNRSISWGPRLEITEPINPDFSVGLWESPSLDSREEAEAAAKGMYVEIDLQAGEYLIFVPIDDQTGYNSFGANRGEVTIQVLLLSQ